MAVRTLGGITVPAGTFDRQRADDWFRGVEDEYRRRTPGSKAAFGKARGVIPGGVPGGLGSIRPYPLYVTHAEGAHVWDVDGHRYLDVMGGDWVLPLGHCVPEIMNATIEQARHGTTFCTPHATLGYEMATLIREHLPSMERIRFTASGTEATHTALRLARGFTGRGKVAKMRGGYHGTHDVSLIANGRFQKTPDYVSPGLIPGTRESLVLLPFNDPERCRSIITEHAKDLAAVIVEPMLGGSGMIPGTREFLQTLREVTERHGIVLIFDEMVTFPVGPHGYQGLVGLTPDLTTVGKAISGGVPLGAFGGRADIMSMVDPVIDPTTAYRHGTTLGGAPIALATGKAAVEQLTPEVFDRLGALGEKFRSGIRDMAGRLGLPLQVTGIAHVFGLHFTPTPVVDFDSAQTADREVVYRVLLSAMNEGVLAFLAGTGTILGSSTPEDIDHLLASVEKGFREGYADGPSA